MREYNNKMGGVDLTDRMISYYRMSVRTKKWTLWMLMHFTDVALANCTAKTTQYAAHQERASCNFLNSEWKSLRHSWTSITMHRKTVQTSQNRKTTHTIQSQRKSAL